MTDLDMSVLYVLVFFMLVMVLLAYVAILERKAKEDIRAERELNLYMDKLTRTSNV